MNLARGLSVSGGQRSWRVSGNKLFGLPCIYQYIYQCSLRIFQTLAQSLRITCQLGLELRWVLYSSHHPGVALTVPDSWLSWEFRGKDGMPKWPMAFCWFTPAPEGTPWLFLFIFFYINSHLYDPRFWLSIRQQTFHISYHHHHY